MDSLPNTTDQSAIPAKPQGWIAWCVAAASLFLVSGFLQIMSARVGDAPGMPNAGMLAAYQMGYALTGITLPLIVALLFIIAPRFRTRRSFFQVIFWVSLVLMALAFSRIGKANPVKKSTDGSSELVSDSFSMRMPCESPQNEKKVQTGSSMNSYFCNWGNGKEHLRVTTTWPSVKVATRAQFDKAAKYLVDYLFKDGKIISASTVKVADAEGIDYFYRGLPDAQKPTEGRLRIFVAKGYAYQLLFIGQEKDGSKSAMVQQIFDSLRIQDTGK